MVAALAANARAHPRRVAMRQYRLGRWHEMMWLDVATATARVAAGLQRLGVRPGDHVGLISSNRPEWVIAELAAQSLGAVTVGIDPGWPDLHVRAVLAAADCRAVVVEDGAQLDRVGAARDGCAALTSAVVVDDRGLELAGSSVVAWPELVADRGANGDADDEDLGALARAATALRDGDPAIAVFAGPGARREGALITHGGLVAAATSLAEATGLDAADELLAHAPLAGIAGQITTVSASTLVRAVVNYGAGTETLAADLRFVQPTIFLAATEVWELMRAEVERRMADASGLKRRLYGWARGSSAGDGAGADRGPGRWLRGLLVDRALRAKLGLRRLRVGLADGNPVSAETATFFASLGVHAVPALSHREAGGFVAMGDLSAGLASGCRPLPGVELALDRQGCLLALAPSAGVGAIGADGTRTVVAPGWVTTGRAAVVRADGSLAMGQADHVARATSAEVQPASAVRLEETRP